MMNDFEKSKEYFIKVFIMPYKLDSATKNMMINSFIFGYKIRDKLEGLTPWIQRLKNLKSGF